MNRNLNPKLIAMMTSCALIANATNLASFEATRAQVLPADAQQIVQTMRPMYKHRLQQRAADAHALLHSRALV
jgi:predicted membrane-bound spermidine synthase